MRGGQNTLAFKAQRPRCMFTQSKSAKSYIEPALASSTVFLPPPLTLLLSKPLTPNNLLDPLVTLSLQRILEFLTDRYPHGPLFQTVSGIPSTYPTSVVDNPRVSVLCINDVKRFPEDRSSSHNFCTIVSTFRQFLLSSSGQLSTSCYDTNTQLIN